MNYWKIILLTLLVSCNGSRVKDETNFASKIVVENYTGNVIIFFYTKQFGDKVYLYQIKDDDSLKFKNGILNRYIENNISIQMRIGENRILEIINEQISKKIMTNKACNLPYDSMYYVKAFISYKNFTEIPLYVNNKNLKKNDNCKTVLISTIKDESGIDSLYIYQ